MVYSRRLVKVWSETGEGRKRKNERIAGVWKGMWWINKKKGIREVEELKEVGGDGCVGVSCSGLGDDEDDRGGWFQPHTAEQKLRRDIINSWIFCVSHLTAGWRWKGPAKPGIPPQLQEEWQALRLLHHQPRALGHRTTRPHSPCGWIHRFKVMGEVCAKSTLNVGCPLPEGTPKPQLPHSLHSNLFINHCGLP